MPPTFRLKLFGNVPAPLTPMIRFYRERDPQQSTHLPRAFSLQDSTPIACLRMKITDGRLPHDTREKKHADVGTDVSPIGRQRRGVAQTT